MTYTDVLRLPNPEWPLEGRNALVIGGASGTGEAISKALALKGAHVVITSRTIPKMLAVQHSFETPDRITPLVLDVTDKQQIDAAAHNLGELGLHPDILILAAAGGLEDLMRPMMKFLFQAQRLGPAERIAKLAAFNESVQKWVSEYQIHKKALAINFQGMVDTFEAMLPLIHNGGSVIYISSIPSSLAETAPPPSFYNWIAQTKRMFEFHLAGRANALAARGIQTAVVTGALLSDTAMGQILIQKGLPLLSPEQRFPDDYRFPTTLDMVEATMQIINRKPDELVDYPVYRMVAGKNDIRDTISPSDPAARFPFPA